MSRMKYMVKRTFITLILIYLVISAIFLFFQSMPGDFVSLLIANRAMGSEQIAQLRAAWGLDEPLYIQYIKYIQNMLTGNAGQSFRYRQDVWTLVAPRILNSAILIVPAVTTSYLIGSVLGGIIGRNRGSLLEKSSIVGVSVFRSVPEFFLGILLIGAFSFQLDLLPVSGMLSTETMIRLSDKPFYHMFVTADFWKHFILPYLTIVLYQLTYPTLIMRNSVVEITGQDFLHYHRLKGLPSSKILQKLIRHASLPVITLYPITLADAISGIVLVEVVFDWPGIGALLVSSVLARDFPVVQFVFVVSAIWIILGNFLVDILYGVIDPRVSVSGEAE